MEAEDIVEKIAETVQAYASLADRASRVTHRARVLKLLEQLPLAREPLSIRALKEEELTRSSLLRGAIILHLDLSARSPLTSSELIFTAATGRVVIAEHPKLPGFPVGIALLLPSVGLPAGRRALYTGKTAGWGASPVVVQYAIATNPGGLGAGRALVDACRREASGARFVAYAPLTGLRARIIRLVDDDREWSSIVTELGDEAASTLLRQLTDLLARDTLPDFVDEPAKSFLKREAEAFAASANYRIGEFHRHLGARCVGIDAGGDPSESDSMWTRVYLEYPPG